MKQGEKKKIKCVRHVTCASTGLEKCVVRDLRASETSRGRGRTLQASVSMVPWRGSELHLLKSARRGWGFFDTGF